MLINPINLNTKSVEFYFYNKMEILDKWHSNWAFN